MKTQNKFKTIYSTLALIAVIVMPGCGSDDENRPATGGVPGPVVNNSVPGSFNCTTPQGQPGSLINGFCMPNPNLGYGGGYGGYGGYGTGYGSCQSYIVNNGVYMCAVSNMPQTNCTAPTYSWINNGCYYYVSPNNMYGSQYQGYYQYRWNGFYWVLGY